MSDPVVVLGLVLTLGAMAGAVVWLRREFARQRARARVGVGEPSGEPSPRRRVAPFAGRWWIPVLVAAAGSGLATFWTSHAMLWSGVGFLVGTLAYVALAAAQQRHALALEDGLAEAISLASAALRAGASPLEALERASQAIEGPARAVLLELTGRLRLGELPEAALEELAAEVQLESFRLFSVAVGVQWRSGGSLERSLSTVARAIRDRVELLRRIQTQSAPTRSSVFVLVAATVGVALLMWQNDPANLTRFVRSDSGSLLVGGSIWLQAIGIVWMSRLARVEV